MGVVCSGFSEAFQAEYEGLIPFTRSSVFRCLGETGFLIPTKRARVISDKVFAVCSQRFPPLRLRSISVSDQALLQATFARRQANIRSRPRTSPPSSPSGAKAAASKSAEACNLGSRLTPIPGSSVGFRSVLNNRCAASTFVAQRSSQRATRRSTRAANRSRAAASTGLASKLRSDSLLTSLRAFILPSCRFGGGSGPAPRVTLLLCGSAPLRAEKPDPVSPRTCTSNRPAEQAAGRGQQSLRCGCVRCASRSSRVRAVHPRRMS